MRNIAILALPGSHYSGIAAFLDLCVMANRYTETLYEPVEGPSVAMAGHVLTMDGGPVIFADGRRMSSDGAVGMDMAFEAIFVPAFRIDDRTDGAGDLDVRLGRARGLCAWLRHHHDAGSVLAASATAVPILAETGLLDGGEASVPMDLAGLMRRRYPSVRIDGGAALTAWKRLYTASAMGAEPALALRIMEDVWSANLGDVLSRLTGIRNTEMGDWRGTPGLLLDKDPVVERGQLLLQEHFATKCSIADLADTLAVSQKMLTRRFKRRLGMTPQQYLQHLRMAAACNQLTHTSRRIDRIAFMVGYADVGFFREKFREHTSLTPAEYRRRAR
ncbi:MAG: helix-turn-helix domain-containing protein [Sphingomonadales bacterium]